LPAFVRVDPRSSFMDEGQFKSVAARPTGWRHHGLVVTIDNGQLKVISPEDGSPAARAGVRPATSSSRSTRSRLRSELGRGRAETARAGRAANPADLRHGAERPVDLNDQARSLQARDRDQASRKAISPMSASLVSTATNAALADAVEICGTERAQADRPCSRSAKQSGRCLDAAVAAADASSTKVNRRRQGTANRERQADQRHPRRDAKGLPVWALVNGGTAREPSSSPEPCKTTAGRCSAPRRLARARSRA